MALTISPYRPYCFYNAWEDFIKDWYNNKHLIGSWSDPDLIPLLNDTVSKSLASDYVPEPWWGNHDVNIPLHSVVVNFNPGYGESLQLKSSIPYHGSYANDIVDGGFLPKTEMWHATKRAKPIHDALIGLKIVKPGSISLQNHLSVELIPFHTQNIGRECGFLKYLKHNALSVMEYSLLFAANESRRIANGKLKNVVILKMSKDNTDVLLDLLSGVGYRCSKKVMNTVPKTSSHCYEFAFNRIPGIRFISIWGSHSMNRFPKNSDLKYIIDKFI